MNAEVKTTRSETNKIDKTTWGVSTIIDLESCNPDIIRSADAIKEYANEIIKIMGTQGLGKNHTVHFGEAEEVAGYSMLQFTEGSLISGHFANQTDASYIDIRGSEYQDLKQISSFTKDFFQGDVIQIHQNNRNSLSVQPVLKGASYNPEGFQNYFESLDAWGLSTNIDASGCNPDFIRSAEKIQKFVWELVGLIDMTAFGDTQIVNKGSGLGMAQLIETSLISGDFDNETNSAFLDVFSCKFYDPHVAAEFIKDYFQAQAVSIVPAIRYNG